MRTGLFLVFMLIPSLSYAVEAQQIAKLIAQQVEIDSADYARRMDWSDYRYTSKLRNPPSVAKLPKCAVDLDIKTSSRDIINNVRYKVSCPETENNQRWSINVNSSVNYFMEVATLKRTLNKGDAIQEGDLLYVEKKVRRNDKFFFKDDDLIGEKTRRQLKIDTVLKENDIQVDSLVFRKREVLIVIQHEHLNMTAEGIPLKSGELGDSIPVKNKRSGNEITATVIGRDKVAVKVY